jgi:hypothetical protein
MEVQPGSRSRGWVYAAVLVGAVVATAAATGLLVNIFERK